MEMVRRPVADYSLQTRLFRLRPRAEGHRVAFPENGTPDRQDKVPDAGFLPTTGDRECQMEMSGSVSRLDSASKFYSYPGI